jgi:hypothetical protein
MKKILASLFCTLIIVQIAFAQNNTLIVYSQDGLKFSVVLNGIKQNTQPETNVKITGLNAPNYQVKIIFNSKTPDIDQNVYLVDGGIETSNTEYSYSIKNVKGKYKLRFNSIAPIAEVADAGAVLNQTTYSYTPVERTTIVTTTSNPTGGNNANFGMNLNGINMSVNVNDMNSNGGAMGTTTTTTTTTYGNGGAMGNAGNVYVLPGYNGIYGCPYPMNPMDFESARASIKAKSFDDSKLTMAKQIIGSNCMLSSQIRELMLLLSFESNRLDLAKFAWHHNLDKGNYFKLNDAFTFESSIDELNQYIQTH